MMDWNHFLSAMTLALVRVSGIVAFAPFFSSTALPMRAKVVFVLAVAYLLAPLVATLPNARAEITFSALLGEVAVGLVYGLTLALLNEMLLFAGQIVGLQFSFSLVNLLDPASAIQTPLLGELFELMGTLVILTAGLDRILLASIVRSFRVAPLGSYAMAPVTTLISAWHRSITSGRRQVSGPGLRCQETQKGGSQAIRRQVFRSSLLMLFFLRPDTCDLIGSGGRMARAPVQQRAHHVIVARLTYIGGAQTHCLGPQFVVR